MRMLAWGVYQVGSRKRRKTTELQVHAGHTVKTIVRLCDAVLHFLLSEPLSSLQFVKTGHTAESFS